jgi:signal transduction histidine kinase
MAHAPLFQPLSGLVDTALRISEGEIDVAIAPPQERELAAFARALERIAREAERRLAAAAGERDRLRATVDGMSEGVLVVDARGVASLVNPAFRSLFDLPPDAPPARCSISPVSRAWSISSPPCCAAGSRRRSSSSGSSRRRTPWRCSLRRSLAASGAVVLARDLSESERLQKMRRDFVANVSHELKTPLAAIRGCAETLVDGAADDRETARRFSQRILDQCRRLGELLEDLLTLSRLESAAPLRATEPVALVELASEAIEAAAEHAATKGVRVTLRAPDAVSVTGDAEGLRRLLDNLLDNAVKYNREGGEITVRVERQADQAELAVTDDGMGIDPVHLSRIFERFYRVDPARNAGRGRHRPRPRHRQARRSGPRWPRRGRERARSRLDLSCHAPCSRLTALPPPRRRLSHACHRGVAAAHHRAVYRLLRSAGRCARGRAPCGGPKLDPTSRRSKMKRQIAVAGLCALALLVGAAGARAGITGLYYQEIEKDGRVYVFNTSEGYHEWQLSGEMGKSITLVGRAAGGKTLIGENETAVDLYLFKHNLPGYERDTLKPSKPPFDLSWKDGKTTIKSKQAELKLSNRVQIRFTETDPDGGGGKGSFRIRRAKTKFEGWVYSKDLTYELQLNFADSSPLEDANVTYDFTHGKKLFLVKAGRFKVPFGIQELTSSGSQQFVDRSIVSNAFARGRDIGLQLWGTPNGGKIDWRVGVFNGNGRTVSRNDNDDLQVNARLAWQPFGEVRYSESAFEGSDKFLFAIAGNFESNKREIAAAGANPAHQNDQTIVGVDVSAKYKGFSAYAERFERENDRTMGLADFDDEGLAIQVGYFVVPNKLEVALRHATFDPNKSVANNDRTEQGIALGWFWNKHNHKLQADYRQIEDDARRNKDKEIRFQYQVIF